MTRESSPLLSSLRTPHSPNPPQTPSSEVERVFLGLFFCTKLRLPPRQEKKSLTPKKKKAGSLQLSSPPQTVEREREKVFRVFLRNRQTRAESYIENNIKIHTSEHTKSARTHPCGKKFTMLEKQACFPSILFPASPFSSM